MSRRAILRALRRGEGGPRSGPSASASPLPPPDGPWQRFDDPAARFAASLEAAGGRSLRATGLPELAAIVGDRIRALAARRIYVDPSLGLDPDADWGPSATAFDGPSLGETHAAAALELAVLPASFGVAENGAVWVDGGDWPHPALHVLPEHLLLVVPDGCLVHTLHEAYERLDLATEGFGAFLAGPSKTADIEQALVKGAHGPLSLEVVWLGSRGARS